MQRQQASGLGVAEFCRREGVALSTFHWWRRRLAQTDGVRGSVSAAVQWIEAVPGDGPREAAASPAAVCVRGGDGLCIEFAAVPAAEVLRAAVAALQSNAATPC